MSDSFLAVVNMRAADASNAAGMTNSCYDFDPLPLPETLPPTVSVEAKPGRGRILTMNQPAAAGDCVLAEAPVCWWVDVDRQNDCCARCLKADLKHVCGECLGTMAPIAGKGADAPCVCNRCGVTRTQEEFLERVESHFNGEESDSED